MCLREDGSAKQLPRAVTSLSVLMSGNEASATKRNSNAILTEAMRYNGRMSFNSYDRFFPNQDQMSEGGFGNLVALPLQGQARKRLNSVFVDDDFLVYKDLWAFLYHINKVTDGSIHPLLR